MNRFALVLVLILSSLSGYAAPATDSERVQAAERMLTELGFGEIFVAGTRKGVANYSREHPERSADLTWVANQITAAEAVERIAPIYAEYMTKFQADEVRIFFATPPGSKFWNGLKAEFLTGRKAFSLGLNWQEEQTINAFVKSNPSWAAFNRAQSLGADAIRLAGQVWVRQVVGRNVAALSTQLADALEDGKTATDPSGSKSLSPNSSTPAADSGFGAELIAVIKDAQTRRTAVSDRFGRRRAELDLPSVLSPANLLSKDGIEDGRHRIALYETALSANQRESDQLDDELMQRLRELPVPKDTRDLILQGVEQGATASYERSLRWQENQRRSLNITRQILDFAEQRLGQVRLEGNKLIFRDIDELHTYESLVQQLWIEAQAETELLREQRAAQESAVHSLRSAGTKGATIEPQPLTAKAAQPELTAKAPNDVWLPLPKDNAAETRAPCNSEAVVKGVPYAIALRTAVERCLVTPPNLAKDARCELEIHQTETGKVTSATVGSCHGHPLLGDYLIRAALKASPLPLPSDRMAFMPVVRLIFNLNGTTNKAVAELSSTTELKQLEQRITQLEAENAEAMRETMRARNAKPVAGDGP